MCKIDHILKVLIVIPSGLSVSAPAAWNMLQTDLQLEDLVSAGSFTHVVKGLEANQTGLCTSLARPADCYCTFCFMYFYVCCMLFESV